MPSASAAPVLLGAVPIVMQWAGGPGMPSPGAFRVHSGASPGLFGALAQVLVAGVDAGPGVEDGNDRLALVLFRRDAEAAHPGAVAEHADAVGAVIAEPAVASELLWGLHAWYRRSQHAVASRVPPAARTFMW